MSNNADEREVDTNAEIDIEEIMRQLRQQILAEKGIAHNGQAISLQGRRFPPEFYEHLYHAGLAYDQISGRMHVTKVPIPIIGRIIEIARTKIHELVLFYVNQLSAEQIKVNHHLLQAISIMSQTMEEDGENGKLP